MLAVYDLKNLADIRAREGLTQTELADKAGCGPHTIFRIENKRDAVKLSTARKIARALRVDLAELVD
jgi:DNA-binding XRE family transcriptional regulator